MTSSMQVNNKYSLALDYHENSKSLPELLPFDQNIQYKIYPNTKKIQLCKNISIAETHENDTFIHFMMSRKSTRAFSEQNLTLAELSQLLTISCGRLDDPEDGFRRTYASAGARYPIEVYVVILRSDDLEKGIYHYNVKDNSLEHIKKGDFSNKINNFYSNQANHVVSEFPCLILFSIVFKRSMEKYGERGYRFALLDAGHMSQNLYLTAAYLNLGIVALGAGGDSDDELDDMIGLLHTAENVFYGFAVGYPKVD